MKKRLLSLIAFVGVFILWGCPNNVTPPEPDTLEPVKAIRNGVAVLLAVYAGNTRLIDNRLF